MSSVSALWYLCGDVVYCVLFPQLTMALFDSKANRSGALAGLAASTLIRLSAGEATLGLPAWGIWPVLEPGVDFPFRTVAMVSGFAFAFAVSRLSQHSDPPKPLGALTD